MTLPSADAPVAPQTVRPARLALDHLTVVDCTPCEVVAIAAEVGCQSVCLFLQPMEVLPRMPSFELIGATAERRETRRRCQDLGITVDLAYPFTLTARTELDTFQAALETAAWLEVRAVNTLLYDRDPQRRLDKFTAFCQLAAGYDLAVAVEFYPLSQVRTLREALDLVACAEESGSVGVNVDLLHLMRSGGRVAEVAAAPAGALLYAQYCDGQRTLDARDWSWEASSQRLLPGEGEFDVQQFARSLPIGTRCSVEVPQEREILQALSPRERAARAVAATRRAIDSAER